MHRIDLTRFDLNLLVVFEALWAERHVGRAAQRLHLTQSATSHALGRLRLAFDDPLFVRHPKGVEPTPRGAALAAAVDAALREVRRAVAPEAPFDPARLGGAVRIGATDFATVVVLAPALAALGTAAPGLDLRILPLGRDTVAAAFDTGKLDIALGSYPETPQRIAAQLLFEDRFVGIARAGHAGLQQGFHDAASLSRVDYALVSLRGDDRSAFDEALARTGLSRRVAVTTPHFLSLPSIVAASDLVALVPSRMAYRFAGPSGLAVFDLPIEVPGIQMHLLCARERADEPVIRWMTGALMAAAASAGDLSAGRERSGRAF